jgi:hypothetical protein
LSLRQATSRESERLETADFLAARYREAVTHARPVSLHGNRYRDRNGEDLWAEALKYLGRAIRRKHGLIWIDKARMVPNFPWPYKPLPKFTLRKRRPRTAWYKEVASRAEENGLSISEQIAADRNARSRFL